MTSLFPVFGLPHWTTWLVALMRKIIVIANARLKEFEQKKSLTAVSR